MDALTQITAPLDGMRSELAAFYQDLHRNPELSMQETRTASKAAERLRSASYSVTTGIGNTGVVGILENGVGPTVMLRADMDALPVREQTALSYASEAWGVDGDGERVPIMHACGHDLHVTCLAGAGSLFARNLDRWAGRLMMVFQPAEEIGSGAKAMINDGLFDRFGRPDIVLGQHVTPAAAGSVAWRSGVTMSAADSFEIKLFGRGSHGSRPQSSIDPVVMAASLVMRLQTIVAREVAPSDHVVVTVGSLHAGTKENVIPDQASIKLNVRSFSPSVRQRVLDAIRRIAVAEAAASGAPREPEFRPLNSFPILANDPEATIKTVGALTRHFGDERVREIPLVSASEDFGEFGTASGAPSVFWYFGGLDPAYLRKAEQEDRMMEVPSNHSPMFAPMIEPTLSTGVHALVACALSWLQTK